MIEHPSELMDWIIKGVVAASFAGWALVLKYFGGQYIDTMKDTQRRLGRIERKLGIADDED